MRLYDGLFGIGNLGGQRVSWKNFFSQIVFNGDITKDSQNFMKYEDEEWIKSRIFNQVIRARTINDLVGIHPSSTSLVNDFTHLPEFTNSATRQNLLNDLAAFLVRNTKSSDEEINKQVVVSFIDSCKKEAEKYDKAKEEYQES